MLPRSKAARGSRSRSRKRKHSRGVWPVLARSACGQLIYSKDNKIIDIEGNPDTPHTLGRLCPKRWPPPSKLSNNPLRPTQGALPGARLGPGGKRSRSSGCMTRSPSANYDNPREALHREGGKEQGRQRKVAVNRLEAIASLRVGLHRQTRSATSCRRLKSHLRPSSITSNQARV